MALPVAAAMAALAVRGTLTRAQNLVRPAVSVALATLEEMVAAAAIAHCPPAWEEPVASAATVL